jgi:hypothetical protein
MQGVRASGTFKVVAFTSADPSAEVAVAGPAGSAAGATAAESPVGAATLDKRYEGEVRGHSATVFAAAFDHGVGGDGGGFGPYVALESFEGLVGEAAGTFEFAHSAGTGGAAGRDGGFFTIVPASGTGGLSGIRGSGGMAIDTDGTHRIWFEYELG